MTAERTAVTEPARDEGLVGVGPRRTVEIREGGTPVAPQPDPEQLPEKMD